QDVLGSLMLSNEVRRINGILRSEHFIEPLHAFLFDTIMTAFDRFGTTNPATLIKLIDKVDASAWEAKIGRTLSAYFAELASHTISGPAYLERSARKVVQQWARVRLAEEAA